MNQRRPVAMNALPPTSLVMKLSLPGVSAGHVEPVVVHKVLVEELGMPQQVNRYCLPVSPP